MLRITELDDGSRVYEELIDGTLIKIGEEIKKLDNDKKTPYRNCIATYKNSKGVDKKVSAKLWEKSLTSNPESFVPNAEITLAVQTKGSFRGFSKVELPNMLVDLDDLFGRETEETASTVKATEEPVEADA